MRTTSSSPLLAFVALARPSNFLLPMLAVIAGFLFNGLEVNSDLYVALLGLFLLHSAVTIWNDIEDRQIDKLNGVDTLLTRSTTWLQPARWVVAGLVAGSFVCCLLLPFAAAAWLVGFFILSWAYNTQPLRLSLRPLSSIVVLGLCYGFVPIMLGASSAGQITSQIILLAVFWSIGRVSLSILKDYKDAVGDAKSSKKTFLLVYGNRTVRLISLAFGVIAFLQVARITYPFVASSSKEWFYVSILPALVGLVYLRLQLFRKRSYKQLNEIFRKCLEWQLICDGIIVAWLST